MIACMEMRLRPLCPARPLRPLRPLRPARRAGPTTDTRRQTHSDVGVGVFSTCAHRCDRMGGPERGEKLTAGR